MKKDNTLFQLTPKQPVAIKDKEFQAYLYIYGAHFAPYKEYTMTDQFLDNQVIIRSTKFNKSPITTFYDQGCIMVRFRPQEAIRGKGNQIQFYFRVKRKYPEDVAPIQLFLWNDLVKEETITSKDGEDHITFLTDVPEDEHLEIYLRPYAKENLYTLIFKGLIAYLLD